MADDDDSAPAPPAGHPNRTMQIDALTDVQLVDNADGAEDDAAEAAPAPGRAPPPLPPSKKRSPVAMAGGFALVVVVTGGLGALGANFLVPPAEAPAPALAPVASPPPAAEPEPEMRHVRLDDEFVIGGPAPDAGTRGTPE